MALPPIRVPFSLSFEGTDAELADLTAHVDLAHLVRLDLTRGKLTNAGLLALAELPNLTELTIHYRVNALGFEDEDELSDDLLKHLAGMKRLTTLRISGSGGKKFPPASLAHLTDVKTLATLTIEGSSLTEEGLRHVARIPGLTTLNLGDGVVGYRASGVGAREGAPIPGNPRLVRCRGT